MGASYKRLGATTVTADTDTSLYTVPASTEVVISSIVICNTGVTEETFRVALVDGAIGSVTTEDYIYYDIPISANDTFIATAGFTLEATYSILVRSSSVNVVFSAFGSEVT